MTIFAIISILATWFLAGAMLCGMGLLFMPRRTFNFRTLMLAFWLGYAGVIGFLQIWHLFWPVSPLTTCIFAATAIAGWVYHRKRAKYLLIHLLPRTYPLYAGAMLVVLVWIADRSLGHPMVYDTGLYHWNVIRWNSNYPIIAGLVNLHERLAFNNSSLLFPAILEFGFWHGRSNHFATGILLMGILIPAMVEASRLQRGRRPDPWNLYLCGALMPALAVCIPNNITSHFPDMHTLMVILVAGLPLMLVAFPKFRLKPDTTRLLMFLAVIISALAITHKLSGLFFAGPTILVFFTLAFKQGRRKELGIALACAAFLVIPWLARGIILSGYPLYPFSGISLPVDWREPQALTDQTHLIIRDWARWLGDPASVNESWPWWFLWPFNAFLKRLEYVALPGLFTTVIFSFFMFIKNDFNTRWHFKPIWVFASISPALICIVMGMATAPDPRFFCGATWYLSIWLFVVVVSTRDRNAMKRRVTVAMAITMVFWVIIGTKLTQQPLIYAGGTDLGFYPNPTPELTVFTTNTGLKIFIPDESSHNDSVWDSPLPASNKPRPKLMLREPGDIRSGFRSSGPEFTDEQ